MVYGFRKLRAHLRQRRRQHRLVGGDGRLPLAVLPAALLQPLPLRHLVLVKGHHRDLLQLGVLVKPDHAVDERKQGVVLAQAHVLARVNLLVLVGSSRLISFSEIVNRQPQR